MRRWTWGLTVAALFLGAVVLALFYGPQEAQTTVTAAAGEQRIVEFDDGSSVRLVGAARLSYEAEATSTEERRVSLTHGRAYFDVAPREEASFVVNTPAARAEALGTQFGVTTGSDTTEVVLVEGKVRVGSSDETAADPVVLQPGQRSLVREGTAPAPPTPADLTARLEWTGLFVFRTVPTTTIAERLSEHYEVSISVASALTGESVTGTFERDQSVTQILETIARTLEAEVQSEEEDTYRLVPAS